MNEGKGVMNTLLIFTAYMCVVAGWLVSEYLLV